MKKSVRMLALLLCVLSIAALLPTQALAADADSVKEAVLAVTDKVIVAKDAKLAANGTTNWTVCAKSKCKLSVATDWYVGYTKVSVKFQWYVKKGSGKSWTKISGATKYFYTFTATKGKNNWCYRCKITVKSGTYKGKYAYSDTIRLKVKG